MVSRVRNYFKRRREEKENDDVAYYRDAAKIYEGQPKKLADAVGAKQRSRKVEESILASYREDKAITDAREKQKAKYDLAKSGYNLAKGSYNK